MKKDSPPNVHPTPETWVSWAVGGLDPAAARAAERHARACPDCHGLKEASRVVALAARPGALEPVPALVRRRAERLFAAHAPKPSAVLETVREVIGRLRVLVAPAPFGGGAFAGAGVRAAGPGAARRCTLASGSHRVELEWTPEGERWSLRGRIVEDVSEAEATAIARARGSARSGQRRAPGLTLEFGQGRPRRVAPGPRGFFGPIASRAPEVRVTLRASGRVFRSPWLPAAPRPRRTPRA
jgi:hypothetical protein